MAVRTPQLTLGAVTLRRCAAKHRADSIALFLALKRAGVPGELHIYSARGARLWPAAERVSVFDLAGLMRRVAGWKWNFTPAGASGISRFATMLNSLRPDSFAASSRKMVMGQFQLPPPCRLSLRERAFVRGASEDIFPKRTHLPEKLCRRGLQFGF
jgi:hypothetical protein